MEPALLGLTAVLALIAGTAAGHFYTRRKLAHVAVKHETDSAASRQKAEAEAREIRERADQDAARVRKEAELKAKDEYFQKREDFNRETEKHRGELRELERKLEKKDDSLEQRQQQVLRKEKDLEKAQKKLADKQELVDRQSKEFDEGLAEQKKVLYQITGMSKEAASAMVLARVEEELSTEIGERIRKQEDLIKASVDQKSREILASAIQRYAAQHTAETTVSTVDIPSDDMKGRIIGREGRNIRTFEKATGVDVIVDDTPGVVIVSAFDNVRRETARLSLAKLIQDGRIHPTRIEEVVLETQQEMEKHINEIGRKAVVDADVGHVHEKLVHLLGRLKFRTSYSQNVLQHSLEVCHLCGMMAGELGLDPKLARRCALLHDIGKAADHEMEGGHPKIGAELAKRYGETNKDVLHAIVGHHDDITVDHIYTVIVAAADAISASRPGARRETLEKYVKRLEQLEAIACGFPGIDQAFAIQAGRELRVIANANRVNDADSLRICRDIAKAIEEQLDYPGEIKVTVVREQRFIEFAR